MSKTKIKKPTVIKVSVTATDIRLGVHEDPYACPIARAIKRCAHRRYASATAETICIANRIYKSPAAVRDFIFDFDRGQPVKPFKFTLSKKPTP